MTDIESLIHDLMVTAKDPHARTRMVRSLALLIVAMESTDTVSQPYEDRGLSVKEASFKMGISRSALNKKLNRGEVEGIRIGKRGWVVPEHAVQAWLGSKR